MAVGRPSVYPRYGSLRRTTREGSAAASARDHATTSSRSSRREGSYRRATSGFLVTPGVAPHVKSGRLVALAVSGKSRSGLLPQVPTVTEAGLPGATLEFSMMLMVPAKTPDAVVARLNEEAHKAMKSASVQKLLKDNDYDAVADTPEQAAARLAAMSKQMADLISKLGIKAD